MDNMLELTYFKKEPMREEHDSCGPSVKWNYRIRRHSDVYTAIISRAGGRARNQGVVVGGDKITCVGVCLLSSGGRSIDWEGPVR